MDKYEFESKLEGCFVHGAALFMTVVMGLICGFILRFGMTTKNELVGSAAVLAAIFLAVTYVKGLLVFLRRPDIKLDK